MGIKKFFKIKPPEEETPEQNRDTLMELGISTKNPQKKRKEKFTAYGNFARDKAEDKVYAPPGYENYGQSSPEEDDLNKSALDGETEEPGKAPADPYSVPSGGADPYAVNPNVGYGGDPYADFQSKSMYNKGQQYHSQNYGGKHAVLDTYTNGSRDNYNEPQRYGNGYNGGGGNPYGSDGREAYNRSGSVAQQSSTGPSNSYSSINRSGSLPQNASQGPTSNPYAAIATDSYASGSGSGTSPYGRQRNAAKAPARSVKGPGRDGNRLAPTASIAGTVDLNSSPLDNDDLNNEPRAGEFDFEQGSKHIKNTVGVEELDLNATMNNEYNGDDFNAPYASSDQQQQQAYEPQPQWQIEEEEQQDYGAGGGRAFKSFEDVQREEEARQQQEEDEAVDEIKQDIRFTKQSSMASTRNTLKMAQEAEMSGMNTLGLLGHQSEKLNNVERNLDLMKVQNKIADDKVAELKKLNRNILAVHVSNPFNSRRRQREREEKIKNRKIEEKLMQEQTSRQLSNSTQRIEGAMRGNSETGAVRERYQRQQILERAKKYQFENDEEDDMMEVEIDRNLDQIQQISGRLKKLAIATGDELDSQQKRVNNIEDSTDDLDIKIHLNTTRLSGIR